MGNPSAEKLGLFKRAFNLIDPSTSVKAGYSAVGKSMKSKHATMGEINNAYKSYIGKNATKAQRREAVDALRTHGFKPDKKTPLTDQIDKFQSNYKDKLPNMKKFNSNPSKYIQENAETMPTFLGGMGKDYFTNGTKGQLAARYGMVGAGYAGAAVGSRYLAGGSATRDKYGNKDIAGLPFI